MGREVVHMWVGRLCTCWFCTRYFHLTFSSSCLFDLCDLAHQVRAKWNITSQCCKKSVAMTSSLLSSRANDPTPLLKNHCNSELVHCLCLPGSNIDVL